MQFMKTSEKKQHENEVKTRAGYKLKQIGCSQKAKMIEEEEWSKEQEANRKPGQKHPTPSPGFADRVFYESLLHQRPESKMARKWCLEYGVLKWAEAEVLCKELGVAINVTRPGKSPTSAKRTASKTSSSSRYDKQEARAAEELGLGGGAGYEGVGLSTL